VTFQQQILSSTQCAGAQCPERDQCQRYRRRDAHAPWASFDIERQQYPGPCVHRLKFEKKAAA
jgi:hypothetical protein